MLLLALWQTLLGRYTAQTDIVVATTVANRARREFQPIVGFFVNTLALRTELGGAPTFEQLLGRVKRMTLDAFAHELAPFEQVVAAAGASGPAAGPAAGLAAGSTARTLQVMLVVKPESGFELAFGPELLARATPLETGTSKFELLLDIATGGEAFEGYVEYSADLFDRATIERLVGHLLTLASEIVQAPSRQLSALEILTPPERD